MGSYSYRDNVLTKLAAPAASGATTLVVSALLDPTSPYAGPVVPAAGTLVPFSLRDSILNPTKINSGFYGSIQDNNNGTYTLGSVTGVSDSWPANTYFLHDVPAVKFGEWDDHLYGSGRSGNPHPQYMPGEFEENLLPNSDASLGLIGWYNPSGFWSAGRNHAGPYFQILNPGGVDRVLYSKPVPLGAGRTVTLSASAYMGGRTSGALWVDLEFVNSSGGAFAWSTTRCAWSADTGGAQVRQRIVYTTPANTVSVRVRLVALAAVWNSCTVQRVLLAYGDTFDPWVDSGSSLGDPAWISVDPPSGTWQHYDSASKQLRYRQLPSGLVVVEADIKSGAWGAAAMTLPLFYRPSKAIWFTASNGGAGEILSDGQVVPTSGNLARWRCAVSFVAEQ